MGAQKEVFLQEAYEVCIALQSSWNDDLSSWKNFLMVFFLAAYPTALMVSFSLCREKA
jgi:hypothetical protein